MDDVLNDKIHFTVTGKPVGKERPRYSKYTGGFYTPIKTKNFEKHVALCARQSMMKNAKKITNSAVCVNVIIYHKVPASYNKQKRAAALANLIYPIKTPDVDNVLKCVMDGMENVIYENDHQVIDTRAKRLYGSDWSTSVEVEFYEV